MKIAVSAMGDNLDAIVDARFGRCPYFLIVEIERDKIKGDEVIKNPGVTAMGGAGIQAAQIVASKKVKAVVTGNMGPNAFGVLSQAGIKVITGVVGISVKDAVQKYMKGELKDTTAPTASGFGLGRGTGRGMGRGRGGGMGRTQ